jgi:two-component system sensor histidine kinase TctE
MVQQGKVLFNLPQSASEILRADESDTVYFQVLGVKGEYLAGERDLPLPPESDDTLPADPPSSSAPSGVSPPGGTVQLRDAEFRGIDLRVAHVWVRMPLPGEPQALVQVAETREKRSVLATEGIKPLHRLEERIRARRPEDLSPINHKDVPLEVVPLVDSVNDLLGRLGDSLATQKRFLADAAHQLKTPLAGLRMQAELAQREGMSTGELRQSLAQIARSSMRATHTVNQLLALARAESAGVGRGLAMQPCNLVRIVTDVVRDCLPRAMDKHVDLGYDGAEPSVAGVWLQGNATLLTELVRNLVDNAINYTPSSSSRPGMATVRVLADPFGQVLLLQVEDSGPGVPEAERELVFQPFYRVLGSEADGSGLGLPIVLEIARQHGAQVALEDAHPGQQPPGARFSVRFTALRSLPKPEA